MATYESAAFRDLSIPPVGRAMVAGGHRPRVPHFILPSPERVARVLVERLPLISGHAFTTASEIVCGLMLGTVSVLLSAVPHRRLKKLTQITMPASSSVKRYQCLHCQILMSGLATVSHQNSPRQPYPVFPVTSTLAGFRAMPRS